MVTSIKKLVKTYFLCCSRLVREGCDEAGIEDDHVVGTLRELEQEVVEGEPSPSSSRSWWGGGILLILG